MDVRLMDPTAHRIMPGVSGMVGRHWDWPRSEEVGTDSVRESSFADVLKENGWRGDSIGFAFCPDFADEDLEDKQTIYIGGNCCLEQANRDAFWAAVKAAFKRGDGLFDTEEWYENYKREENKKQ